MKTYVLIHMIEDEPLPINYRAYSTKKAGVKAFNAVMAESGDGFLEEFRNPGSLRYAASLEGDCYVDLVELTVE
jgi:hypothetical protein